MPLPAINDMGQNRIAETLVTAAISMGSASHPYLAAPELRDSPEAVRNLADVVHHLCLLHGRMPGVIDLAVERAPIEAAAWMISAAANFTEERALLTRLVVAAPPVPSTPGQAECEATVLAQHHAIEMLARSERAGCAMGAAAALLLDWQAVRAVLDLAAERLGLDPEPCRLPDTEAISAFLIRNGAGLERAITFGAQQMFIQQRGLWDLLECREQARR